MNGLPSHLFDGVNDAVAATSGPILNLLRNVPGATVFVAVKLNALSASQNVFYITTPAGLSRAAIDYEMSGNRWRAGGRRLDADSFQGAATNDTADTSPAVLAGVFDYENSDLFVRKNGLQIASSTSFQTSGRTSDTASLSVNSGNPGAFLLLNGSLSEILVWPRVLSSGETAIIERYLSQKYSIRLAT
jgi:hypothetical protein